MFAATPKPPYLAVIFSSQRSDEDPEGYAQTAEQMVALAAQQPGFLGVETTARDANGFGMTVSYWRDRASIRAWRAHADHVSAQSAGRGGWYRAYRIRIAEVSEARAYEAENRARSD